MTPQEIFHSYLSLLWKCFEYDVEVFSSAWIYVLFLIPACVYLAFFFVKWIVLTVPVWLPIYISMTLMLRSIKTIIEQQS